MIKDGDYVIYIGDCYSYALIKNKQYKVRHTALTLTTKKQLIMLNDYGYLGHLRYNNIFISLKEYRKQKLNKISK